MSILEPSIVPYQSINTYNTIHLLHLYDLDLNRVRCNAAESISPLLTNVPHSDDRLSSVNRSSSYPTTTAEI